MARTKNSKAAYAAKFKDPRWQRKRLEILEMHDWECQGCCDRESTLHVHHLYYTFGADPWDYPDDALVPLCENCHELEEHHRKNSHLDFQIVLSEKGFLNSDMGALASLINDSDDHGTPMLFLLTLRWFLSSKENCYTKEFVDWCDGRALHPQEQQFVDWIRQQKLRKGK